MIKATWRDRVLPAGALLLVLAGVALSVLPIVV